MATYGVTPEGFIKKTYEVIFGEMKQYLEDTLGKDIDLSSDSDMGQWLAITAEQRAKDWDVMEAVYYSMYPNTATGISLDNASQATNHTREPATFSTTTLEFTGDEGAEVPAGSIVRTSTGIEVATNSASFIPVAGVIEVPATSTAIGNVSALAGTLTVLPSPILGITSVTNLTDLTGGQDRESDQEFRLRRVRELQRPGTASIEGIRNTLLNLDYMEKALVVDNTTLVTDPEGRPPKSFEAYVSTILAGGITDPANAAEKLEIAEAIFYAKAAGIETYGSISQEITDTEGFTHTIYFSEPTPVPIAVVVDLVGNTDPAEGDIYPDDGDDLVKEAILAYGDTLDLGQDVWLNKVYAAVSSVLGVKEITTLTLNGSAANVVISSTEVSTWDSSNITVTSS